MDSRIIKMNYCKDQSDIWSINIEGRYSNAIRDYLLNDGIPSDGTEKILQNASRILSYCPNPIKSEKNQKTGLVIGKVQSGKTSNFISLTGLAFDNGYNIVVVLGGTKKPLVKQNSERINEYFYNINNEVFVLDTNDYREELTDQKIAQFIQNSKKIIIVALKSPAQINFINDSLFKNTVLSDQAILIIDDEGDEASLNTLVKKGRKSSTYLAIERLKHNLNRHCYVSVTATPQANMLIGALDVLSPEFGVLVDPGIGYCGLDVYHGENSKYTIPIPNEETSLLDDGIPKSFNDALSMFFVGCGVRKTRGMKDDDKFSMLIHPSQMKADHQKVYDKIEHLLNDWKKKAINRSDISYSSLSSLLNTAYLKYQKDEVVLPAFSVVENIALMAIRQCGLHVINGDKVANDADKFYDFNIYVGGNMLGRGLTIKGLAVTYIIRTAKGVSSVDTVQQRARWFGYKTKYLDLCRVFAASRIIKQFSEIRDHEKDLWETVHTAKLQGIRFKEISRIFVLSDDMRMTRSSVAKTKNYSFTFWNFQRVYQEVPAYIANNIAILSAYKEKHCNDVQILNFGVNAQPHKVLYKMDFEEVKKEIFDKFIFPEKSKLNQALVDKLLVLLKSKGINPVIDVIWIRDGVPAVHPVSDGVVSEYMVGRRPADKTKLAKYAGDRYMLVKSDIMQLQIHEIQKKDSNICSPTIAFYVPIDYVSKITNLVIRD